MKLYVVPTPVGNMEDMTLRAIRVLKEADFILAEDTRVSGQLLKRFGIENKLLAHHKFNEHQTCDRLVERIRAGATAAVISDAGTPGLSDPGFLIARSCIEAGIPVECLPGATAAIPALVNSGLPMDRFCFEGFLPQKKGRQTRLRALASEPRTMVFYESPYRVVKTLGQFEEVFGPDRMASYSREISKVYNESMTAPLSVLREHFEQVAPKGEFVLVVAGRDESEGKDEEERNDDHGEMTSEPYFESNKSNIKNEEQ